MNISDIRSLNFNSLMVGVVNRPSKEYMAMDLQREQIKRKFRRMKPVGILFTFFFLVTVKTVAIFSYNLCKTNEKYC